MTSDPQDWLRRPGGGGYARPERERRFLVRGPVPTGEAARLIEDRYLTGTTLRLRRVTGDGLVVCKLTQKVRQEVGDPSQVAITNVYLSQGEHRLLSQLPGDHLTKTRTVVRTTHAFVVDAFSGPLTGLLLAEVEVQDLAEPVDLPPWLGPEVTLDDRFSGGRLATADPLEVLALAGRT